MEKAPVDAELAPMAVPSIAPELRSTLPLADRVVKAPDEGVPAPMAVASIAPELISALLTTTLPEPLGVIAIFPFDPSVMVIEPVVELPVCKVTS